MGVALGARAVTARERAVEGRARAVEARARAVEARARAAAERAAAARVEAAERVAAVPGKLRLCQRRRWGLLARSRLCHPEHRHRHRRLCSH